MKYLFIILILFCGCADAQTTQYDFKGIDTLTEPQTTQHTTPIVRWTDSMQGRFSTLHYTILDIDTLLSDWKAYKTECWNDSTKYQGITEKEFEYQQQWLVGISPHDIWTHREPTLDGFMEYLGKKYKDKKYKE